MICKVLGRHVLEHVLTLKIKLIVTFSSSTDKTALFLFGFFAQYCSESSNECKPEILQHYKDIIQVSGRRLLLVPKLEIFQQAMQLNYKIVACLWALAQQTDKYCMYPCMQNTLSCPMTAVLPQRLTGNCFQSFLGILTYCGCQSPVLKSHVFNCMI